MGMQLGKINIFDKINTSKKAVNQGEELSEKYMISNDELVENGYPIELEEEVKLGKKYKDKLRKDEISLNSYSYNYPKYRYTSKKSLIGNAVSSFILFVLMIVLLILLTYHFGGFSGLYNFICQTTANYLGEHLDETNQIVKNIIAISDIDSFSKVTFSLIMASLIVFAVLSFISFIYNIVYIFIRENQQNPKAINIVYLIISYISMLINEIITIVTSIWIFAFFGVAVCLLFLDEGTIGNGTGANISKVSLIIAFVCQFVLWIVFIKKRVENIKYSKGECYENISSSITGNAVSASPPFFLILVIAAVALLAIVVVILIALLIIWIILEILSTPVYYYYY